MNYFATLLSNQPQIKSNQDPLGDFNRSWLIIKSTLQHPDERQLSRGINATDVPARLRALGDALVHEAAIPEYEGGTGPCMEYLLKNDVLGTLVRLSEPDRPAGVLAEVLRTVSNMVVLLDEQFLIHSAVHKAIIRLLRACTGDEFQDKVDGKNRVVGAAAEVLRAPPSDYELDLVDLLCVLCSRIRTYRQLLLIFFHDKNWFPSNLTTQDEENKDLDEDEEEEEDASPSPVDSNSTITSVPSPKKPEYEFLLFNYLLRYVHREGRIGDFARAGVLFLMDVAMGAPSGDSRQLQEVDEGDQRRSVADPIGDASLALAEYVLDGDFADVLGAGLVAVYSLLPSKLEVRRDGTSDENGGGMSLGARLEETRLEKDEELEKARTFGLESSADPTFQSRLDHFLKIIEFLQDVFRRTVQQTADRLEACALVGAAISTSILQSIKSIFLENVLYPSILESSDTDGSAVAVVSYIDMMLKTLPDGPFAELLIDFLMNEDESEAPKPSPRVPPSRNPREAKLRKRKSSAMMLLELDAPKDRRQSTYFASLGRFTLKDLVFSNLRSQADASSAAVLQLLQTLLQRHPRLTTDRLLSTFGPVEVVRGDELPPSPQSDEETFTYPGSGTANDTTRIIMRTETTLFAHERELGLYLNLVSRVDPTYDGDDFSTGYDNYLRDALEAIQMQQELITPHDGTTSMLKYRLNADDTLLSLLLQSLRTFFAHSVEYNVALTGTLAAIASCPTRSLAGWMTFAPPPQEKDIKEEIDSLDLQDDGDDRSIDLRFEQGTLTISQDLSIYDAKSPILHDILRSLVLQIDRYRHKVDGFDDYLKERRQGLMFSENLTDALNLSIELDADSSFFSTIRNTLSTPSKQLPDTGTATPPQSRSFTSLIPSFFTPKKERPSPLAASHSSPAMDRSASDKDKEIKLAASPFGQHYKKTCSISVQPLLVENSPEGSIPQESEENEEGGEAEDVFSPQWNARRRQTAVQRITLSQLLDNVVIMEEFMKELSAIIQMRRSIGIDSVRYV